MRPDNVSIKLPISVIHICSFICIFLGIFCITHNVIYGIILAMACGLFSAELLPKAMLVCCQSYLHEQTEIGIEIKGFHSTCICKWHMQNYSHFLQASMWLPNTTALGNHRSSLIARFTGANMGPIWGRQDPCRPHVGPMNLVIWDIILLHGGTIRPARLTH